MHDLVIAITGQEALAWGAACAGVGSLLSGIAALRTARTAARKQEREEEKEDEDTSTLADW